MNTLLMSIAIGIVAGIVDILPMVIMKMNRVSIISAFLQYFFVSIIIVNIDLPGIAWWLEGSIISLALALPIIIIVSDKDKKAGPIIGSMAIILGASISIAGHYLT
jgi:hypothetical protein